MHKHERRNSNLELAVHYGIIIDAELGCLSAWMSGVSESVIKRVLLTDEKRREGDQIALDVAKMYSKLQKNVTATRSADFHLRKFQVEMT